MPRPGYEPEDDFALEDDDAQSLLARFEPAARAELMTQLDSKSIEQGHVEQMYRLISISPEDRDSDALLAVIETAAGMTVMDFSDWVGERIAQRRDQ